MGMSESIKVIVSLFLVVLLALAATQTESRYINYHALHGDHSLICDKANPSTCKKEEANPYTRGCEIIDRCRGQSLGPKICVLEISRLIKGDTDCEQVSPNIWQEISLT
ncbi:hypothetical protein YC2023_115056 [Brassica napus]